MSFPYGCAKDTAALRSLVQESRTLTAHLQNLRFKPTGLNPSSKLGVTCNLRFPSPIHLEALKFDIFSTKVQKASALWHFVTMCMAGCMAAWLDAAGLLPRQTSAPQWWTFWNWHGSSWIILVPSGKHTKNYGKSPFFMGKSIINGHFQ